MKKEETVSKFIIPLIFEGDFSSSVPSPFNKILCLDFTQEDKYLFNYTQFILHSHKYRNNFLVRNCILYTKNVRKNCYITFINPWEEYMLFCAAEFRSCFLVFIIKISIKKYVNTAIWARKLIFWWFVLFIGIILIFLI